VPIYQYRCEGCGKTIDLVQLGNSKSPICCSIPMRRLFSPPALIKIKGQPLPARRKWMDNWTPDSPKFSTGSYHGARY